MHALPCRPRRPKLPDLLPALPRLPLAATIMAALLMAAPAAQAQYKWKDAQGQRGGGQQQTQDRAGRGDVHPLSVGGGRAPAAAGVSPGVSRRCRGRSYCTRSL